MSTLAETPPIHELLARFTHPEHGILKDVLVMNNYRGDCTETGDRRLRAMLGAAYDSLHYDTVASNGRVVLFLPRCKAPNAVPAPDGWRMLTAEHHWALSQVDEKHPEVTRASAATIQRVPVEIARQLHDLPELEFVEVPRVYYWLHAGGPAKRKSKPAPDNVVYFRFLGGYGVVAC
jgi:hypothetical protein